MARDFAAELEAARLAGDWDAHSRIWEERRVGDVEADEASIADEVVYAPGDKVMFRDELAEIDSRYEISGDYIVLCADGLYRSASCLALSRPAGSPDQTVERSALVGGVQLPGTALSTPSPTANAQDVAAKTATGWPSPFIAAAYFAIEGAIKDQAQPAESPITEALARALAAIEYADVEVALYA